MTVGKLIELLRRWDPEMRVAIMTEVGRPRVQVEHWVTDVARYVGSTPHAIIIGHEWENSEHDYNEVDDGEG